MADEEQKLTDVESPDQAQSWFYSETVKDHFFNPRNFLKADPKEGEYDGEGQVGSPACGDKMHVWIKVDPKGEKITEFKWRTFGCASAIAATSMLSEMVMEKGGMSLDKAQKLKPQDIIERLSGLPARKIHCSVLGDQALRAAVNDYYERQGKNDKITPKEQFFCPFKDQCNK
ncbi:iron-sulfur cluster assembly scaffold protein [Patescibacteria group bacterium]|nr:iron-sulfur cluster assembly scaffold protein [Patescibacteria group bacterium]MBU1705498.1 iron-sulfur cluster assembly scaffold protein [Patescibacteria group bacterium]